MKEYLWEFLLIFRLPNALRGALLVYGRDKWLHHGARSRRTTRSKRERSADGGILPRRGCESMNKEERV